MSGREYYVIGRQQSIVQLVLFTAASSIWEDTLDSDNALEKVYHVRGQTPSYSPTHWLPSSI